MKKFPWVSREHLEDTKQILQARVDTLEAEKKDLLDRLLSGAVPDRRAEVARVNAEPVVNDEIRPITPTSEQGAPVSYTTPFDRTLNSFDAAHKNGVIPIKFRARL